MKRRKKYLRLMLRNRVFWTTINFEIEYFLNEETEGVLTDTVKYFHDWHLTCFNTNLMFRWDTPFQNHTSQSHKSAAQPALLAIGVESDTDSGR